MKYSLFAFLLFVSSAAFAQDVKIQGPKKQSSVSTQNQNGNAKAKQLPKPAEQKLVQPSRNSQELRTEEIFVNGVSFKMCYVKGGDFLMGSETGTEGPIHKASVEDFYIGQTEVTNALWNAVMNTNFQGNNLPVNNLSHDECDKFIVKLNSLTGLIFRLPTEEEWEFACRGGNNSKDYKYSGSNFLEDVAWYKYSSGETLHNVATKQSNELGIYDMCGNVQEWCRNFWSLYPGHPNAPFSNTDYVYRGGSYKTVESGCTPSWRWSLSGYQKMDGYGLRLALTRIPPQYREQERQKQERQQQLAKEQTQRKQDDENRNALRWDDATKTFYYNGQSYKMVAVEGGTFEMGIPKDRKKYMKENYDAAKPHNVTLSGYYIGQTEFTRGFLRAILGEKNGLSKEDLLPQGGLSWDDCKRIADWLSQFTGKNFCIPSEAEWEFAARGGNRSHGYEISGCNINGQTVEPYPGLRDAYHYAVTNSPSNGRDVKVPMNNVGSKRPNELGLYDMTGNVWEWCADWYAIYETKSVTNPLGPVTGTKRVYRGGSHLERNIPFVFERYNDYPDKAYSNVGFRLCLRQ